MGEVTVLDGSVQHTVNLLGPRASGQVRQAVVIVQPIDELTELPVRDPVHVSTSVTGLYGQSAASGVAGLVGVPSGAFPKLDSHPYQLDVTVRVAGFVPWTRTVMLAQQAGFPATFVGVDLGRPALRRRPITVAVTTYELDAQHRPVPLGGVDVRITRVWRRLADLRAAGVVTPMIGLPLGVSQRWPVGTALDSVGLLPGAEPTRRLLRGVSPGEQQLSVDQVNALVAGDLVGLDLADLDRREYLLVAGVVGPAELSSPAVVETSGPVRVAHAESTIVRRIAAPAASPADATLTEPAEPGDTTVFVDTTAALATVEVVRATNAAIADEYLDSHLFRAITDASGVARLPALSRVAAVQLTATRGALSASTRFTPDYLQPTNALQLTLR